ncbi:MAG TPA: cyanophycin synthetase [Polyangiaceae bacterium]
MNRRTPDEARASAEQEKAAILESLVALPKFGDGIGLQRILHFLEEVAATEWFRTLDAIKVTGSKGKGSVSTLIASILQNLGLRVGVFTSPHLLDFAERIAIDGRPIPSAELAELTRWILALRSSYEREHPSDRAGAFEAFTAMAVRHFARNAADAVVSEAGIGGRYDPTRAIPGALVALTSIELEHTDVLGKTKELIALDKSDLCPSGGTLVTGDLEPELVRRLQAYCRLRSVELVETRRHVRLSPPEYSGKVMRFRLSLDALDFGEVSLHLPGEHQARNAALAALVAWHWVKRNRTSTSDGEFRDAVRAGLASARWPGRLQVVSDAPEIVIDVGHTPESARTIASAIRQMYPGRRVLLVTGVSANKDVSGVLAELVPLAERIVCTRAYHRGSEVSAIAAQCAALRPDTPREEAATIEQAVDRAREQALRDGMVVLITGGLFLAVEAATYLAGGNPRDLKFF